MIGHKAASRISPSCDAVSASSTGVQALLVVFHGIMNAILRAQRHVHIRRALWLRPKAWQLYNNEHLLHRSWDIAGRAVSSAPSKPSIPSKKKSPAQPTAAKPQPGTSETQPLPSTEDDDSKGPQPLSRPIGVTTRPKPGENTGIDPRSWRQRRDDFLNYDKHLERRRELTAQVARPYFRDWTNMRYQKGKVFIAPERMLRADKARYFPNLRGITAAEPATEQDTTDVLVGRISIVSVYTGTWAQRQTTSFVQNNAPLQTMLAAAKMEPGLDASEPSFLQCIDVNAEPNWLRHAIVKTFLSRQRRLIPQPQWPRYFVVHRGFDQALREKLGMFNAQVGYVFLLDADCRIRWAGSADASEHEVHSLNRAVVRLAKDLQRQVEDKAKGEASDNLGASILAEFVNPKGMESAINTMAEALTTL